MSERIILRNRAYRTEARLERLYKIWFVRLWLATEKKKFSSPDKQHFLSAADIANKWYSENTSRQIRIRK